VLSHLRLAGAGFALAALLGSGALALAAADGLADHPMVHTVADSDDPGGAHAGSPGTLSGN
jgi:hypothetical protein